MSKLTPFALADYVPVELRHRSDGWTAARQIDFLLALSESACVVDACRTVGKSVASAYALRRRIEAVGFRGAWDAALDYSVARLGDAALSRALNGVARPVFYKGEQIGERLYYDERLTMFILRRRDPARFGSWRDRTPFAPEEDARARQAENSIYDAEAQAQKLPLFCDAGWADAPLDEPDASLDPDVDTDPDADTDPHADTDPDPNFDSGTAPKSRPNLDLETSLDPVRPPDCGDDVSYTSSTSG